MNHLIQAKMAELKPLVHRNLQTGSTCPMLKSVKDYMLLEQSTQEERVREANRVEIAFRQMDNNARQALFVLATHIANLRGQSFMVKPNAALFEYTQDERAAIASAIQCAIEIRASFPPELKFYEFHPKNGGIKC